MGTRQNMIIVLKKHLGIVHRIFPNEFLVVNMLRFLSLFWDFVWNCMCCVFGVLVRYIRRYERWGKIEFEQSVDGSRKLEKNGKVEEETESSFGLDSELAACSRKCQFQCGKDIIGYIEESEIVCFSVQECFGTSHNLIFFDKHLCEKVDKIIDQEEVTSSNLSSRNDSEKEEDLVSVEDRLSVVGEVLDLEDSILRNRDSSGHYSSESVGSSDQIFRWDKEVDFIEYRFLPGRYFCEEVKHEGSVASDKEKVIGMQEDICLYDIGNNSDSNETFFSDEELLKLDQDLQNTIVLEEQLPEDDNSEVDFLPQDAATVRNLFEAKEPIDEELRVLRTHDEEDVGPMQNPTVSEEVKLQADGNGDVDSVHQEEEVTGTLDDDTEPKLQENFSHHYDYGEQFVKIDQHLQYSTELYAENLTGDDICDFDLVHQETEETRNLDKATELRLLGKLSASDDSGKELPTRNQHNEVYSQIEAEKFINEGDLLHLQPEVIGTSDKTKEPSLQGNTSVYDVDDPDDVDEDHDDLVYKLKAELQRARTGGLPTILEESESPKVDDEYLRPMKIDEKFEHKDRIEEIQKVYKSYADKMRKLDMLNYQALNTISLHQKKDPKFLTTSQKLLNQGGRSFLPQKANIFKALRVAADPTLICIKNLHKDLEMVYVGQVCLSWEILHWEYWKARELQENDSQGFHHYNRVANEFQLFQVLIQRFLEDEQFQGPRVTNYVNRRCNIRTILQIPAIKDDSFKERRLHKGVELMDAVSSEELIGIVETSMQVFWEFLCADKDADLISKGSHNLHVELQDPSDSELLINIRSDLQKKERKLREILRSGNCIIKRFRRHHGENQMHWALFFAQVELKVISRVINMSKPTTNQLQWCHEKLGRVHVHHNRIYVEPLFLLFPC